MQKIDTLDNTEAVHKQLDDVQLLYDAVDPSLVDLVDKVIARLNERLQSLSCW